MPLTKFRVDKLSLNRANELVTRLKHQQKRVIEIELPRAFRTFGYGSALKDVASQFSDVLRRKRREIPLDDVEADVEDFGMLMAIAHETNARLPAIRLGLLKTVPVFPPAGQLTSLPASRLFSASSESVLKEISGFGTNTALILRPAASLRELFFNRLRRFLAVRIAGVQWATSHIGDGAFSFQSQPASLAAGAGGGSGGTGGTSSTGYPSAQKWTVHTSGTGHSIYYGAYHGIRSRPIYLNAPTTPVEVFLPMGTIILAADAGPGGNYVWDRSVIEVPSLTPVYHTKAF